MDDALREVGILAEYERLAEDVRVLRRTIEATRETADSADGTVAATVDGHSALVELWLDPRIYRNPDSSALAATITDTIRQAARQAEERVFDAVAGFLPDDATFETTDVKLDPLLHHFDRR